MESKYLRTILDTLINRIDKILYRATMLIGCTLLSLYFINPIYRNITHSSFYWIEELGGVLQLWMTFFGTACIYINDKEAEVSSLVDLFSEKARFLVERIVIKLCLIFGLFLLISSVLFLPLASRGWFFALPFPTAINLIPLILLAIVTIIHYTRRVIR